MDYDKESLADIMLELVRAAVLERVPEVPQDVDIDWDKLLGMSAEQGLLAWVWDGICKLPADLQPSRQQRINWGLSAQEIWDAYGHQKLVLEELVKICKQNNIRLLLLKGIGLSKMYPNPASRPSGDIDIYLFGDFEKGNKVLAKGNYVFTNKHAEFDYNGVRVENHQSFFYHGTCLQIDVDNYILSAISKCNVSKDGYYILPPMEGLVYLLLHTMVHLNNPVEHVTLKNLVDVAYYLFYNKNKLDPKQCGCIMRKLDLERAFDLYLQASEWVLSVDFSYYRNELSCGSKDLDNIILLLLDDSLRSPQYDNHSFVKQLIQRISYYNKTKWRYGYMPNWKVLNRDFLKRQLSIFVKSLFRIPFNVPLVQSKKHDSDT